MQTATKISHQSFPSVSFVLIGALIGALLASPVRADDFERLKTALDAKASRVEIVTICKTCLSGDARLVPLVSGMLRDPELSHAARLVLQRIDSPKATDALANALGSVKDTRTTVGILHSLEVKRDVRTLDAVKPFLTHGDDDCVRAAASAVGAMANEPAASEQAVGALLDAWSKNTLAKKRAMLPGVCSSAALLAKQGHRESAIKLLEAVVAVREIPSKRLYGAYAALLPLYDSTKQKALATALVRSGDSVRPGIVLSWGRTLKDRAGVNAILFECYAALTPKDKPAALRFLGETNVSASRALMRETALDPASGAAEKRVALAALGQFGSVSDASALIAALESKSEVADAIVECLTAIKDAGIDALVLEKLENAGNTNRAALLEIAGKRHIAAACARAMTAVDDGDPNVRDAAWLVIGETAGSDAVAPILKRLYSNPTPDEIKTVVTTIRTIATRTRRANDVSRQVGAVLAKTTGDAQKALFDLIGELGTREGMNAVAQMVAVPESIDDATRILAAWKSDDAADCLYEIARACPVEKFRIRALRGYIRLIRQSNAPAAVRLKRAGPAMSLATRDDERRLVLEALGRIPDLEALATIRASFDTESLRGYAFEAAVTLVRSLDDKSDPRVRETLEFIMKNTKNPDLKARIDKIMDTK